MAQDVGLIDTAIAPPPHTWEMAEIQLPALTLPTEDGEPLETRRHRIQINLLFDSLHQGWTGRRNFYADGNMFIYYSLEQAQGVIAELREAAPPRRHYRGPDFFVVLDVDGSYPRKSWVVWEEGGRYPDFIVELLSPSTRAVDLGKKKRLYERTFKTAEYICHDPLDAGALQGWRLDSQGHYQLIEADERGWLWSDVLQLWLGIWKGEHARDPGPWLRFFEPDGRLVPTVDEAQAARAEQEAARAEQEAARAEQEAARADRAEAEAARLREELERLRSRQ